MVQEKVMLELSNINGWLGLTSQFYTHDYARRYRPSKTVETFWDTEVLPPISAGEEVFNLYFSGDIKKRPLVRYDIYLGRRDPKTGKFYHAPSLQTLLKHPDLSTEFLQLLFNTVRANSLTYKQAIVHRNVPRSFLEKRVKTTRSFETFAHLLLNPSLTRDDIALISNKTFGKTPTKDAIRPRTLMQLSVNMMCHPNVPRELYEAILINGADRKIFHPFAYAKFVANKNVAETGFTPEEESVLFAPNHFEEQAFVRSMIENYPSATAFQTFYDNIEVSEQWNIKSTLARESYYYRKMFHTEKAVKSPSSFIRAQALETMDKYEILMNDGGRLEPVDAKQYVHDVYKNDPDENIRVRYVQLCDSNFLDELASDPSTAVQQAASTRFMNEMVGRGKFGY